VPGGVVAASALILGMISLRLMMGVERTLVIVAGSIGRVAPTGRITALAIGTHRLFLMRLAIAFFSRLSNLMFMVEGMYQEKAVQKAVSNMMNTVVASTKVRVAAHRTRLAAKHVRKTASFRTSPRRKANGSPIQY
jgi:hypothetical protein